jgi:hypothetical protein
MQICPRCGRDTGDRDLVCAHCGRDVHDVSTKGTATAQTSNPELSESQWDAPALPAAPARTHWHIAAVALAGLVVGGIGIILSVSGRSMSPGGGGSSPLPTTSARIEKGPLRSAALESSAAPKWIRTHESRWASDGSKTIGFELEAEREIGVWMKRVRPTLAVRCLGRETEVFVVTDSAASIEPIADQHTVYISFDNQAEVAQHWLDSADHRELFAPDGMVLARQIAQARTMRFGFTPFNSSPVVVDFDVRGFGGPLESVMKTCRSPRGRA